MQRDQGAGDRGDGATVGVFMAVRNERGLGRALASLEAQSLRPSVVVVVDDGSTDGTGGFLDAARGSYSFDLEVVHLEPHEESYVGRPELARVLNRGLGVLARWKAPLDFVMKLDGDHSLPPGYLAAVIGRMLEDPRLAVASGCVVGERSAESSPRGSGMVIRVGFWRDANTMRFPLEYGWESWLYLKAQASGYSTRSFSDIASVISRPTSISKGLLYGRGMYALGYFWPYALGRSVALTARSPRQGLQMLRGYLDRRGVRRLDVATYVNRSQKRLLVTRAVKALARHG
ncbi:MAG: glycosyltransferase family 2 protein [Nitrososphaerota archaeon]|nr:glycosyltransferase family 2 protein [Nitrososphaerota archaeon]MDG6941890.1 glycosyltransferase family 2 protein [Nitrososphaerota archaeon]MDG6946937.1 glycosyltransferase family 2 protein [Nitrososphaerota archaeon]MDG6950652.1 glycosyltransferase family 2 protein [Nitrososphaerota archaeon]